MEGQLRFYSIMNDFQKGQVIALQLRKHKGVNTFPPYVKSSFYLHTGLVFSIHSQSPVHEGLSKRRCRKIARQSLRLLQALSGYCGRLNQRRACLLEAEIMAMSGSRPFESLSLFDKAIILSTECNGFAEEGLACERAARLCESIGNSQESERYLRRAYGAYGRWGALAKMKQIEKRLLPSEVMKLSTENSNLLPSGSCGTKDTIHTFTQ
jgi:hypothetical protein